jgi:hypothetical protein
MWSLPDINRLNLQAEINYRKEEKAKKRKRKNPFNPLKGKTCDYCENKAENYFEYYDIFSDIPKGKVFLCEKHNESGIVGEGYFLCDNCGTYFIRNYTWENYFTENENGIYCLNCSFDQEIENPENWFDHFPDFEEIKKAKHVIPNSGEYWKSKLIFIDNCEYDSLDGHQISGFNIKEKVENAIKENGKVFMCLDNAYQFAVSIGFYILKPSKKKEVKN